MSVLWQHQCSMIMCLFCSRYELEPCGSQFPQDQKKNSEVRPEPNRDESVVPDAWTFGAARHCCLRSPGAAERGALRLEQPLQGLVGCLGPLSDNHSLKPSDDGAAGPRRHLDWGVCRSFLLTGSHFPANLTVIVRLRVGLSVHLSPGMILAMLELMQKTDVKSLPAVVAMLRCLELAAEAPLCHSLGSPNCQSHMHGIPSRFVPRDHTGARDQRRGPECVTCVHRSCCFSGFLSLVTFARCRGPPRWCSSGSSGVCPLFPLACSKRSHHASGTVLIIHPCV